MPIFRGVTRPPQAAKTESFATIVNGFLPLNIVAKLSILDVCGGPGYASECWVKYIEKNGLRYSKMKPVTLSKKRL